VSDTFKVGRHFYNSGQYCCHVPSGRLHALTTEHDYNFISMAVQYILNRHNSYIFTLKCFLFMEMYCLKITSISYAAKFSKVLHNL